MNPTPIQIVVAYDLTQSSRHALLRAIEIAAREPAAVLHFVNVVEAHGADYAYAGRVQEQLAREITEELRRAELTGRVHFFVHARLGKPAAEILELAREVGADRIVVGTKGLTGVEHFVLGSVAERVVREAGCTVEIARAKTYPQVDLLNVVEVEQQHRYVPPHRYSYADNRVQMRPKDWPLY